MQPQIITLQQIKTRRMEINTELDWELSTPYRVLQYIALAVRRGKSVVNQ